MIEINVSMKFLHLWAVLNEHINRLIVHISFAYFLIYEWIWNLGKSFKCKETFRELCVTYQIVSLWSNSLKLLTQLNPNNLIIREIFCSLWEEDVCKWQQGGKPDPVHHTVYSICFNNFFFRCNFINKVNALRYNIKVCKYLILLASWSITYHVVLCVRTI